MKTCFLDGPSLARRLRGLAEGCDALDVAMAYVKRGGLETLLRGADSLITKGGSLQIVFGLAKGFGITEWEAAAPFWNTRTSTQTSV